MKRRGTVLGLLLACAVAMSAIGASDAFGGATGFTCVSGGAVGPNKFIDGDCLNVNNTSGAFGHEAIAEGTSTTLTLNKVSNPILTPKLFGSTIELTATGFDCVACTAENASVGGVMESRGSGRLRFTGMSVVGFESTCTVVGSATGVVTSQNLKFTTTTPTEVTFEPETGTLVWEFSITGSSCSIAGSGYRISGKARAARSGARLTFNITRASGELQIEGEKVAFKGEETVEEGSGATHHPVALTTA